MEFRCTVTPHYEDPAFQWLEILALSDDDEAFLRNGKKALPYGTVLGSAKVFRHFDPGFNPEFFERYVWEIMDGISGDLEQVASHIDLYGKKIQYADKNQEADFYEAAAGFLVIDRIQVSPFAKEQGIGLEILREIRRQHAGMLMFCALSAEPFLIKKGKERSTMQKRLISWYQRQPDMHFQRPSPRKAPEFLMAAWDGRKLESADFDVADLKLLTEQWKNTQETKKSKNTD